MHHKAMCLFPEGELGLKQHCGHNAFAHGCGTEKYWLVILFRSVEAFYDADCCWREGCHGII